jgi:hypothetical protein
MVYNKNHLERARVSVFITDEMLLLCKDFVDINKKSTRRIARA